ncbi:PA0069 family radical SAM protein [Acuticoccus sp. M5D2P5]|uniref:PA0069 family radical SAM protein n=1 Tax=Acuticoccus kalidii TaxID=2910977 RepID=UPI001F1B4751|nr:PA0069 family radical SAM protein [Acuticoccus kalidii]MCF3935548.1 PA0069 family radical SAM protein [Acuticoccus kalidii]
MVETLFVPKSRKSGRGADINPHPRFDAEQREAFDDGWNIEEDETRPKTVVTEERAKTIITRNASPDIGFDRSINAYRGCEHGCVYCFARPTHAYLGLSPGLDFETRLFAKPEAAALLRRELSAPSYRCRSIAIGTNTDPYQPIEKKRGITRSILEVLRETKHPVGIVTKSDLVLRDLDILAPMAAENLTKVGLSVTTLNPTLSRTMEPRAPTPKKRIAAIKALADAGVPVSALIAPILPAINDHEIEAIVAEVAAAGATHVNFVILRLPHEVKDIVRDWLAKHFPDRARRVMSVMQAMRGGKDYDATWGLRQRGEGPFAKAVAERFALAAKRHGMNIGTVRLDTTRFVHPRAPSAQMDLFG